MKKLLLVLPLLALLSLLCGCYGDLLLLEEGMPADITVDELLKKMDRATDPQKVYANIKSYYMKQVLTNANINGSDESISEIYWKAPGYLKQISSRNGEVINIIISRNGRFWYVNPKNKKSREVKGKDALLIKTFTDIATPGMDFKKIFQFFSALLDLDTAIACEGISSECRVFPQVDRRLLNIQFFTQAIDIPFRR